MTVLKELNSFTKLNKVFSLLLALSLLIGSMNFFTSFIPKVNASALPPAITKINGQDYTPGSTPIFNTDKVEIEGSGVPYGIVSVNNVSNTTICENVGPFYNGTIRTDGTGKWLCTVKLLTDTIISGAYSKQKDNENDFYSANSSPFNFGVAFQQQSSPTVTTVNGQPYVSGMNAELDKDWNRITIEGTAPIGYIVEGGSECENEGLSNSSGKWKCYFNSYIAANKTLEFTTRAFKNKISSPITTINLNIALPSNSAIFSHSAPVITKIDNKPVLANNVFDSFDNQFWLTTEGTATPYVDLELRKANGTVLCATTVRSTGDWTCENYISNKTIYMNNEVTINENGVYAVEKNKFGQLSTPSNSINYTIRSNTDVLASIPNPQLSTINGQPYIQGQTYTMDSKEIMTLSGSSQPYSTIEFNNGTSIPCYTTSDATGLWECKITPASYYSNSALFNMDLIASYSRGTKTTSINFNINYVVVNRITSTGSFVMAVTKINDIPYIPGMNVASNEKYVKYSGTGAPNSVIRFVWSTYFSSGCREVQVDSNGNWECYDYYLSHKLAAFSRTSFMNGIGYSDYGYGIVNSDFKFFSDTGSYLGSALVNFNYNPISDYDPILTKVNGNPFNPNMTINELYSIEGTGVPGMVFTFTPPRQYSYQLTNYEYNYIQSRAIKSQVDSNGNWKINFNPMNWQEYFRTPQTLLDINLVAYTRSKDQLNRTTYDYRALGYFDNITTNNYLLNFDRTKPSPTITKINGTSTTGNISDSNKLITIEGTGFPNSKINIVNPITASTGPGTPGDVFQSYPYPGEVNCIYNPAPLGYPEPYVSYPNSFYDFQSSKCKTYLPNLCADDNFVDELGNWRCTIKDVKSGSYQYAQDGINNFKVYLSQFLFDGTLSTPINYTYGSTVSTPLATTVNNSTLVAGQAIKVNYDDRVAVIKGISTPNSFIEAYNGSYNVCNTNVISDNNGNWECIVVIPDDSPMTLSIRQTNRLGNDSVLSNTFNLQKLTATSYPNAQIFDSTPADFGFDNVNPTNVTQTCQIDSQPVTTCTSSITYSNLTPGDHVFKLSYTDVANNYQTAIYEWSFRVVAAFSYINCSTSSNSSAYCTPCPVPNNLSSSSIGNLYNVIINYPPQFNLNIADIFSPIKVSATSSSSAQALNIPHPGIPDVDYNTFVSAANQGTYEYASNNPATGIYSPINIGLTGFQIQDLKFGFPYSGNKIFPTVDPAGLIKTPTANFSYDNIPTVTQQTFYNPGFNGSPNYSIASNDLSLEEGFYTIIKRTSGQDTSSFSQSGPFTPITGPDYALIYFTSYNNFLNLPSGTGTSSAPSINTSSAPACNPCLLPNSLQSSSISNNSSNGGGGAVPSLNVRSFFDPVTVRATSADVRRFFDPITVGATPASSVSSTIPPACDPCLLLNSLQSSSITNNSSNGGNYGGGLLDVRDFFDPITVGATPASSVSSTPVCNPCLLPNSLQSSSISNNSSNGGGGLQNSLNIRSFFDSVTVGATSAASVSSTSSACDPCLLPNSLQSSSITNNSSSAGGVQLDSLNIRSFFDSVTVGATSAASVSSVSSSDSSDSIASTISSSQSSSSDITSSAFSSLLSLASSVTTIRKLVNSPGCIVRPRDNPTPHGFVGGIIGTPFPTINVLTNPVTSCTTATFTPLGSTTTINGSIVGGNFLPNSGSIIPLDANLNPSTGLLNQSICGVNGIIDTDFDPIPSGQVAGITGTRFPNILINNNPVTSCPSATFLGNGSNTPVQGSIINSSFVPSLGSIIPYDSTVVPSTGTVTQSTCGITVNITTNFVHAPNGYVTGLLGDPFPTISVINNPVTTCASATFTSLNSLTTIQGSIVNGNFVPTLPTPPNALQIIPYDANIVISTGLLNQSACGANVTIITDFYPNPSANIKGYIGDPFPPILVENNPVISCATATFTGPSIPGTTILGSIVNGNFVPNQGQIIPLNASLNPSTGVITQTGCGVNINVTTDFDKKPTGIVTGIVGDPFPNIPIINPPVLNCSVALFNGAGSNTLILGSIVNGIFVPNSNQIIPLDSLLTPSTGVITQTGCGVDVNVTTDFDPRPDGRITGIRGNPFPVIPVVNNPVTSCATATFTGPSIPGSTILGSIVNGNFVPTPPTPPNAPQIIPLNALLNPSTGIINQSSCGINVNIATDFDPEPNAQITGIRGNPFPVIPVVNNPVTTCSTATFTGPSIPGTTILGSIVNGNFVPTLPTPPNAPQIIPLNALLNPSTGIINQSSCGINVNVTTDFDPEPNGQITGLRGSPFPVIPVVNNPVVTCATATFTGPSIPGSTILGSIVNGNFVPSQGQIIPLNAVLSASTGLVNQSSCGINVNVITNFGEVGNPNCCTIVVTNSSQAAAPKKPKPLSITINDPYLCKDNIYGTADSDDNSKAIITISLLKSDSKTPLVFNPVINSNGKYEIIIDYKNPNSRFYIPEGIYTISYNIKLNDQALEGKPYQAYILNPEKCNKEEDPIITLPRTGGNLFSQFTTLALVLLALVYISENRKTKSKAKNK
jgi:hypothetical protein